MLLYSCGSNSTGQLATSSLLDLHSFTLTNFNIVLHSPPQLALGGSHSVALLNHSIYITGNNSSHQLSPSISPFYSSFHLLPLSSLLAALSPNDHKLIHLEQVHYSASLVAATWESSFVAITPTLQSDKDNHSDYLLVFGANNWGEHGQPSAATDSVVRLVPLRRMMELEEDVVFKILEIKASPRLIVIRYSTSTSPSLFLAWGSSRHGQLDFLSDLQPSSLSYPHLALGKDHLALHISDPKTSSSRINVYGNSKHHQDGISGLSFPSSNSERVIDLSCTWLGTYVLTTTTLYASGSNSHLQLTSSPSPSYHIPLPSDLQSSTITKLSCGSEHVLLLTEEGDVWGWGWNEHGNLGLGEEKGLEDVGVPTKIWDGQVGGKAVGVWAGMGNSWVLVED